MSVQEKLTAIADAIRDKTGGTDALTLDEMAVAIAGITGGSSGGVSGIYIAQITPASDLATLTVTHNLATTDILLAAAWAETLGDIVPATTNTLAKYWLRTDIQTHRGGNGFGAGYAWNTTNSYAAPSAPNAHTYETLGIAENSVTFNRTTSGTTTYFLAGVTYTVVVVAANVEV